MPARDNGLDILVVGSGIAGLSTAIALAGRRRVAVVSKENAGGGSTMLAQGGIAAAVGPGDTPRAHAADTVRAAVGLGDPGVAEAVTGEAAEAVAMLAELGARFDRGALSKEGGHSAARVVHARGDATGAEITRALLAAAHGRGIPVMSGVFLVDLVTAPDGNTVMGALVWDSGAQAFRHIEASTVVLATGGYGQLWAVTTSPMACNGDGLAAALRAGAQVADLEFVQFHPTGMDLGRDPRPLASEALRGAGARLRDSRGEFLSGPDGTGDLAPRDVVSRAMATRMAQLGSDRCYLDATPLGRSLGAIEGGFPTFVSACLSAGISPETDWVPVSPTTHYTMGGVLTDAEGRTTLSGLMAVGEAACSGLHGANRLASNSLLEGAVMGRRAAHVVASSRGPVSPREAVEIDEIAVVVSSQAAAPPLDRRSLRLAMQGGAGVARDGAGLEQLATFLASAAAAAGTEAPGKPAQGPDVWELANMAQVGRAVVALARRRCESRGAHWRTDYPAQHPEWRVRQVAQLLPSGELGIGNLEVVGQNAEVDSLREPASNANAAVAAV
ncbi:MAG TPA: FAD-dependent oxidoreductase [Acidimicrobiales bacterium]|nr:FAD-dependent oxidoreductase [Acidimicrobiales bacterium]